MENLELIKFEIGECEEQMCALKLLPFSPGKVIAVAELSVMMSKLKLRAAAFETVVKTTKIQS
jgi:hypothetical protein